jgi:putative hemolysin
LVLILANGFFAGSEIALVSLRSTRLQELLDHGHRSAAAALALKRDPERLLATVQIGITVVGSTAAAFGGASIAERLAPLLAHSAVLSPYAHELALAVVVAFVSYLSIVVGELVPKSIALRAAERYALIVAPSLLALSWLARPLIWLLTVSSNVLLKPFGDSTTFSEARHSAAELQQMMEDATKSGSLHPQAAEIASRALEFHELKTFEVMVPRQQVISLQRDAPMEEIRRELIDTPHTRLPVHDGTPDNIVGYLNIKELATRIWQDAATTLRDVIRPAYFVPDSKPAVDLLREMQRQHIPLAIVVDEQGSLAGIVTIEDLIEELVGDIFSEYAGDAAEPVTKDAAGMISAAGNVPVRELNRAFDLELPEDGDWNTIAGLCVALARRIPAVGDRVTLPNGVVLEVADATARRVRSVRIHPHEPPHDA